MLMQKVDGGGGQVTTVEHAVDQDERAPLVRAQAVIGNHPSIALTKPQGLPAPGPVPVGADLIGRTVERDEDADKFGLRADTGLG